MMDARALSPRLDTRTRWALAMQADLLREELGTAARTGTDPTTATLARAEALASRLRVVTGGHVPSPLAVVA
jgi:hypothetical protein